MNMGATAVGTGLNADTGVTMRHQTTAKRRSYDIIHTELRWKGVIRMEDKILQAIEGLRGDINQKIDKSIEGLRGDFNQKINKSIEGLRIDSNQKFDTLSSQVQENTQILKALEHLAQVNKAEHDMMTLDLAEISGEVKSIQKGLATVELVTANNWSDIVKLKSVK